MMSMANADNLVFKTCEYSYNYLNQVMDELNDYQAKNDNDISNNFLLYYLSESQNAVIVEMQECYPSKIDEFKRNVSDSPAIQFKQATSKPIDLGAFEESQNTETSTRATSLYAGYPIIGTVRLDNKTYTGSASIGYRVSCDNAKGFITAGHAVSLGQEVKADDEKIGVCDLYDYKENHIGVSLAIEDYIEANGKIKFKSVASTYNPLDIKRIDTVYLKNLAFNKPQ